METTSKIKMKFPEDISLCFGDVLLKEGIGFISMAIRSITCSRFSHALLVRDQNEIFDITWPGDGRCRKFSELHSGRFVFYRYRGSFSSDQRRNIDRAMGEFEDAEYDLAQFFGYLLFGFKSPNLWDFPEALVCSELIDRAYLRAGINLLPKVDPGDATPAQLSRSRFLKRIFEFRVRDPRLVGFSEE